MKLNEFLVTNKFDAIIHFAGFKAVGESVKNPIKYYRTTFNNNKFS